MAKIFLAKAQRRSWAPSAGYCGQRIVVKQQLLCFKWKTSCHSVVKCKATESRWERMRASENISRKDAKAKMVSAPRGASCGKNISRQGAKTQVEPHPPDTADKVVVKQQLLCFVKNSCHSVVKCKATESRYRKRGPSDPVGGKFLRSSFFLCAPQSTGLCEWPSKGSSDKGLLTGNHTLPQTVFLSSFMNKLY